VVIVTLGNFATKYVLQTQQGITRMRGSVYPWHGRKVIPTFHPAAILHGGGEKSRQFGELQEYLIEHARREGYALLTQPRVLVETDSDLDVGEFGIATRMAQPKGADLLPELGHLIVGLALDRAPVVRVPLQPLGDGVGLLHIGITEDLKRLGDGEPDMIRSQVGRAVKAVPVEAPGHEHAFKTVQELSGMEMMMDPLGRLDRVAPPPPGLRNLHGIEVRRQGTQNGSGTKGGERPADADLRETSSFLGAQGCGRSGSRGRALLG
jgi:hypothetical protein